jgi:predicted XRE-type DNA-binding protein/phage-related protein
LRSAALASGLQRSSLKPVEWVGSALDDLRDMPDAVQDEFGYALHEAQRGKHHPSAKQLKGELRGLIELVDDWDGDTSRGVLRIERVTMTRDTGMAKRRTTAARAKVPVTRGSGNVFADLGLSNPQERLAKAQLASLIDDVIRERALTQEEAAALMGIDQPKVSHLLRGRLGGFSTQRLIDFLNALGRDVEIVVRAAPKSRKRGRMHVAA